MNETPPSKVAMAAAKRAYGKQICSGEAVDNIAIIAAEFANEMQPLQETAATYRALAVEALNELQQLRKQIIHGGGWTKKIDDLFERARKAGL